MSDMDLEDFIQKSGVLVLNNAEETNGIDVLGGIGGEVWSDCDAQLLYQIPFSEAISLSSFSIRANIKPEHKECADSDPPSKVKLFINNRGMDFDECEQSNPLFEVDLKKDDLDGLPIKVSRVKFSNVASIALFIETNQEESEMTFLNKITFRGKSVKGTDLSALKQEPFKPRVEEIEPQLFIGNDAVTSEKVLLLKAGITHVLGFTKAEVGYADSELTVKTYAPDSEIGKYFDEAIYFISKALRVPSNKVLVHCRDGLSSSVTIICAYLIVTKKISAKEALKLVQRQIKESNPDFGFWQQLLFLQRKLDINE